MGEKAKGENRIEEDKATSSIVTLHLKLITTTTTTARAALTELTLALSRAKSLRVFLGLFAQKTPGILTLDRANVSSAG